MHNIRRPNRAIAALAVEVDALTVDLSSTTKRRHAPTLLISRLVTARTIGAVPPGSEHHEAARLALDHLERGADCKEGVFGHVDVAGLGRVALMLVRHADAIVLAILAESEIARWHAGHLRVLGSEAMTAHELYGQQPVVPQ